jgi:hypothetical protein
MFEKEVLWELYHDSIWVHRLGSIYNIGKGSALGQRSALPNRLACANGNSALLIRCADVRGDEMDEFARIRRSQSICQSIAFNNGAVSNFSSVGKV